ncbi:MAG: non-canonical purine NTP pyrophosphatase, partial [Myxococcota bacterium]
GLSSEALAGYGPAPEIDETAPDFAGNAVLKAEGIAAWLRERGEPGSTRVLADDSGVCVDVLDGAPGVHSARYCGHHGSDADNNAKLVAELTARGVTESAAHYACVLAVCRVDGRAIKGGKSRLWFEGRWDVVARVQPRGTGGFGYDPHCWIVGEDVSVAELPADRKAALSHRGAAFAALVEWWRGA